MGVLRIKDEVDDILERDPYELFDVGTPHRVGTRRKLGDKRFVAAACALFAVCGGGAYWQYQRSGIRTTETPHAYFEVRVLDPDGRPVAGATVRERGQTLGVTDSFGEWRRFMRVKPGSTVLLDVAKSVGAQALTATKSLAVPLKMPAAGDLELTGSVQLVRAGGKTPASPPESRVEAPQMVTAASSQPSPETRQTMDVSPQLAGTTPNTPTETHASQPATRMWDGASLWITPASKAASPALTAVTAAMQRRVRELGVRLDPKSALHVSVREVAAPSGEGAASLLYVVGQASGDEGRAAPLFAYLRNFQDEALATARDILWAATLHAPVARPVEKSGDEWRLDPNIEALWRLAPGRKLVRADGALARIVPVEGAAGVVGAMKVEMEQGGEPCDSELTRCALVPPSIAQVSPVAGWKKLKMIVRGSADTQVFVSGFAATAEDPSRGIYSYWGQPDGVANLTVLRDDRVVLRARLKAAKGLAAVTVPSEPIALNR